MNHQKSRDHKMRACTLLSIISPHSPEHLHTQIYKYMLNENRKKMHTRTKKFAIHVFSLAFLVQGVCVRIFWRVNV